MDATGLDAISVGINFTSLGVSIKRVIEIFARVRHHVIEIAKRKVLKIYKNLRKYSYIPTRSIIR